MTRTHTNPVFEDDIVKIPLTRGLWATVDRDDWDRLPLLHEKWQAVAMRGGSYYAYRMKRDNGKMTGASMARLIMGASQHTCVIDHINGDTLCNRRSNLRIASHGQNMANRKPQKNNLSSPYKGVHFSKRGGVWRAKICKDKVQRYLGNFTTAEDAARAYNKAALDLFGNFARLNHIPEKSSENPSENPS